MMTLILPQADTVVFSPEITLDRRTQREIITLRREYLAQTKLPPRVYAEARTIYIPDPVYRRLRRVYGVQSAILSRKEREAPEYPD